MVEKMNENDNLSIKSYSRKMASYVLEQIKNLNEDELKKLSSLANKIPAMIRYNGLSLTIAYLYSKKTNESEKIFDVIINWFENESIFKEDLNKISVAISNELNELKFLKAITDEKMDIIIYRAISNEAITLLEWVRRLFSTK